MSKDIKAGDRVVTLPANYTGTLLAAGEYGNVMSVDGAGKARVMLDDGTTWKFHTDRLEVVKTWMDK